MCKFGAQPTVHIYLNCWYWRNVFSAFYLVCNAQYTQNHHLSNYVSSPLIDYSNITLAYWCIGILCFLQCRICLSLWWRHNDHDSVSNHQPHECLLNRLFRRRSKKTSKLRVTGLCVGNSPGPVNSPHKGPVTRKMFLFDDVIMSRAVRFTGITPDNLIFFMCPTAGLNWVKYQLNIKLFWYRFIFISLLM